MDGYSVEEAAEVLGIPQGRVWELIARGVLAGAAEGRSDMRVFLKPAAIAGPERARSSAGRGNGEDGGDGNGGSHLEASPFRELLTEFRNLTERYGQALLALGEARGEVAALRSRVEVIEARMDMRLPLRSASTVAWELPDRYAAEAASAPEEEAETRAETATRAEAPMQAPSEAPTPPEPHAAPAPAEVTLPQPPLPGDEPSPEASLAAEADTPDLPRAEAEPQVDVAGGAEPHAELASEPRADVESEAEPEAAAEADAKPEPQSAAEADAKPEPMEPGAFPEVRFVHPAETAAEPAETAAEPPETAAEPPKRRVTGGRAAVAGLAEALARAEDPTLADLPGAREAAAALAALQQAVGSAPAADEPPPDVAEPAGPAPDEPPPDVAEPAPEPSPAAFAQPMVEVEEEPPALEAPGAPEDEEEAPSVYSTEVVEPDWFADGDFTWLDASDQRSGPPEAPAEPEPTSASDAEMEHIRREAEAPPVDALQEAFDESSPAPPEPAVFEPPVFEPPAPPQPAPEAEPEPEAESESEAEPAPEAEPEPEPEAEPESEPEGAGELTHVEREQEAAAVEAIQDAFDEPDATLTTGTEAWPARDRDPITGSSGVGFGLFRSPDDTTRARVTPAAPPTDEEAILWFGDEFEAGDLEVAAPGWRDQERLDAAPQPGPPPGFETTGTVPAADTQPANPAPDASAPTDDEIARLAAQGWDSAEVEAIRSYLGRAPGIAHPPGIEAPEPSTPAHDQDWLRGRRGPAATAYRRLRRLFQG